MPNYTPNHEVGLYIFSLAGVLALGLGGKEFRLVHPNEMLRYLYIVSAVLFILGLKGLSSPKYARRGMFLAEFGMAVAVLGTLFHEDIQPWGYAWIAVGLAI